MELDFKASEVPEGDRPSFDLIPSGHRCWFEIEEADLVPCKNDGRQITYTAVIRTGPHENRKIWGRINFYLPHSPKAQAIGRDELAALCLAVGIDDLKNTEQLLMQGFEGTIGIQPPKDGYPAKNVIRTYHAKNGMPVRPKAAASAEAKPAAQAAPAPAAAKKKPWETSRAA